LAGERATKSQCGLARNPGCQRREPLNFALSFNITTLDSRATPSQAMAIGTWHLKSGICTPTTLIKLIPGICIEYSQFYPSVGLVGPYCIRCIRCRCSLAWERSGAGVLKVETKTEHSLTECDYLNPTGSQYRCDHPTRESHTSLSYTAWYRLMSLEHLRFRFPIFPCQRWR